MALIAILMTLGASLSWAITSVLMKLGVTSMSRIGFAAIRPWLGLIFVLHRETGVSGTSLFLLLPALLRQ